MTALVAATVVVIINAVVVLALFVDDDDDAFVVGLSDPNDSTGVYIYHCLCLFIRVSRKPLFPVHHSLK